MTHRFRYWRTYPATPTPLERRRGNRVVSTALAVGLILCVAAIVVLFCFVLSLKAARDREVDDRTRAIDQAMCSVLDNFHGHSAELEHARTQLRCVSAPTPGDAP